MPQTAGRQSGSLSGLEFRVLSREISEDVSGTYVSNIYSVGESQLLRMRRPGTEGGEPAEVSLVLSPKLGAWTTERPERTETTEFTSALRSRLLRARLRKVSQLDLDRVLTLGFEGKGEDGTLELVLEMMPPGNILLVGSDGKIVAALHEVRSEARRLQRGRLYAPPPQNRASLENLAREDLQRALEREKTLGRALGRGLSVPRRYVDEILARVSLRQEDTSEVTGAEVDEMMAAIKGMLEGIAKSPFPCLASAGDGPAEVMVTLPQSRRVVEASPRLSQLLDKLLSPQLLGEEEEGQAARDSQAGASKSKSMEYRSTMAGLAAKREGLEKLSTGLRSLAAQVGGAQTPEEGVELARSSGLVPGDLLASLEALAERGRASISSAIFDRAKKLELEIRDIDAAVGLLQSKLKRETGRAEKASPRAIQISQRRRTWYEKFRWFFTTGGKLAVGGRDAQSNTNLVRRHAQEGDTVFHADLFGSPFFVLKGGKAQSEAEAKEVAKATVSFSSAWKTGLGAADAYWVNPDQVASAGPSGEYLAHGSFAIKGRKNFVTRNPVEIAVGIDGEGRVVSGPEESIMKVARGHVTLVPSREKPSEIAKKVLHELAPFVEPGSSPSVDDVLRMLPSGGAKIIRRRADRSA